VRSRIGENVVIKNSYIMGNDFYETFEDIKKAAVPVGIGKNTYIENAIIDKQVRIGSNVVIRGDSSMEDMEGENYVVRAGIIVLNKGAVIPDGTKIGKVDL